jgi:hypothetical protein
MKPSFLTRSVIVALTLFGSAIGICHSENIKNQDPQGFWSGKSSNGYDIAAVVLEDGSYYSLYEKEGIVYGINYGNMQVSGSSFKGSLSDVSISTNTVTTGKIAGSFVPQKTLSGTSSFDDGSSGTFDTSYLSSYDTPASLEEVKGKYVGPYGHKKRHVELKITQDGRVNGTMALDSVSTPICLITGNVVPRLSGKNVYDLTLMWGHNPASNTPCCAGKVCATNTPTTGIAVLRSNATYLYTAWINAAKSSGFLWVGKKD